MNSMNFYSSLLESGPDLLSESSNESYLYFTERHLQAIWLEQKYFSALTSSEGEPIQIISPGAWNGEAGPDFRHAHIRIGERELRGDIELHLREGDWRNHKHHQDERYNNVILHVSLWKPHQSEQPVTKNGNPLVRVYLKDFLTISLSRIIQYIDLDLYPYKKFVGSGMCSQTLYRHLSEEKITSLFESAAEWRLEKKALFLEAWSADPAYQLAAGFAMALGYKNNSKQFLEVFSHLLKSKEENEESLFAASLGMCGYFEEEFQQKWKDSIKYQQLKTLWQNIVGCFPHSIKLQLNQIRPLNSPIRRFVVLAKLLADKETKNLRQKLETCWQNNWRQLFGINTKKKWALLKEQLLQTLPNYNDPYWNAHYSFEAVPGNQHLSLMGEDVKTEILVNVFFPLLWSKIYRIIKENDQDEIVAFKEFYRSYPGTKSGKMSYLTHRFFGDSAKGRILSRAVMEQGAFQIHKDFCIHFEASCEGCPFVERYETSCEYSQRDSYFFINT